MNFGRRLPEPLLNGIIKEAHGNERDNENTLRRYADSDNRSCHIRDGAKALADRLGELKIDVEQAKRNAENKKAENKAKKEEETQAEVDQLKKAIEDSIKR